MGLTPVPEGQVAAVVTSLEMRERPRPKPLPDSPLSLVRWYTPRLDAYRALFRRVGEPWLWFSRLILDDGALSAIIHHADVSIWAVLDRKGIEVGILELDFRISGSCEVGFLGLVPELAGQGNGSWLMAHTLSAAWQPGIERVWLHTCSIDHPSALSFYIKSGFTPYARAIEIFPDPRLTGLLPRTSGPHFPLIG
jgi:GNAT superfamily N-acetyltransferase